MESTALLIPLSLQDRGKTEIPAECKEEEGWHSSERGEICTHVTPVLERTLGSALPSPMSSQVYSISLSFPQMIISLQWDCILL